MSILDAWQKRGTNKKTLITKWGGCDQGHDSGFFGG
jgi:hypothetical protein